MAPKLACGVPQGRNLQKLEVNLTAFLHGPTFLDSAENAWDRVLDLSHHEAIEERDIARASGGGLDPPAAQEAEVRQDVEEAFFARPRIRTGDRGDTAPHVGMLFHSRHG
jgi:hypothetical protein